MPYSPPGGPAETANDSIDADVLPTLSVLLGSVTDAARPGPGVSYDARGAELRDMSRQIIELTRFLAAVAANTAQRGDANIRA